MISDLSVPGLPFAIAAVVTAIIGIIMIVIFINFRRDFAPKLKEALPKFPESEKILRNAVTLAIIVIAYLMFQDLIRPLLGSSGWIYTLIFVLIALYPLYSLITTLYRGGHQVSDAVTVKIAQDSGEVIKCQKCGEIVVSDAKFCPNCAAKLEVSPRTTLECKKCGTVNKASSKFCLNCARPLEGAEEQEEEFEV